VSLIIPLRKQKQQKPLGGLIRIKNQNWSQWSNSDSKEEQEEISEYYEYNLKSEDGNSPMRKIARISDIRVTHTAHKANIVK
jgi:hypothetical protein